MTVVNWNPLASCTAYWGTEAKDCKLHKTDCSACMQELNDNSHQLDTPCTCHHCVSMQRSRRHSGVVGFSPYFPPHSCQSFLLEKLMTEVCTGDLSKQIYSFHARLGYFEALKNTNVLLLSLLLEHCSIYSQAPCLLFAGANLGLSFCCITQTTILLWPRDGEEEQLSGAEQVLPGRWRIFAECSQRNILQLRSSL